MEWFEALILGLIQGLTEYLPVSSSGHLAIGSALFGIEGEENLAFTIVVFCSLAAYFHHGAGNISLFVSFNSKPRRCEEIFDGNCSFSWSIVFT